MFAEPRWMLIAYTFNIIILVPVCWTMFVGSGVNAVFEGQVTDSAGLRLLVGSLWLAILAGSTAGLVWPAYFSPILFIQIFYKAMWLAVFISPLIAAGKPYPVAISATFAIIVLGYPFLIWAALTRSTV